jgi:hypothetical protein
LGAVKRLAVAALATAAVVALRLGVRAAVESGPKATPSQQGAVATPAASASPRVEQTVRFLPTPEDFTMVMRRAGTRCGFAIRPPAELADQRTISCKATYRTTVSYHGKPLDPEGTYTVFYQVIGGVLGSELHSFTLEDGRLPVLPVRSVLVHSGAVLSAVASDVEWLPPT